VLPAVKVELLDTVYAIVPPAALVHEAAEITNGETEYSESKDAVYSASIG
jgi:hypothetical protein